MQLLSIHRSNRAIGEIFVVHVSGRRQPIPKCPLFPVFDDGVAVRMNETRLDAFKRFFMTRKTVKIDPTCYFGCNTARSLLDQHRSVVLK